MYAYIYIYVYIYISINNNNNNNSSMCIYIYIYIQWLHSRAACRTERCPLDRARAEYTQASRRDQIYGQIC